MLDPQPRQKFARASLIIPHAWHEVVPIPVPVAPAGGSVADWVPVAIPAVGSGDLVPHDRQNLASDGMSVPHALHLGTVPPATTPRNASVIDRDSSPEVFRAMPAPDYVTACLACLGTAHSLVTDAHHDLQPPNSTTSSKTGATNQERNRT